MARSQHFVLAVLFVVALVVAPYWYHVQQEKHFRGLRVVTPDVLYRSGQLDEVGLKRIVHDFGIRTVISLREPDSGEFNIWEEEFCRKNYITHLRIQPKKYWVKEGTPPAKEAVEEFLNVMRNPQTYPQPVLLHCFAGVHRTGAFCAVYRMEFERWPASEALREMRECGYTNLDDEWDVRGFIQQYQPSWKRTAAQGAESP